MPDPSKATKWLGFARAMVTPVQELVGEIRKALKRRTARRIAEEHERQERQNERVLGKDYKKKR